MIKLIVFTDGDVTFDYDEERKETLNQKEKQLEALFGIMSEEQALNESKKYPDLSEKEIIAFI